MSDSALKNTFIILGALGIYSNGVGVWNCLDYITYSAIFGMFFTLAALAGLAISAGYLNVGLKFDEYIPSQRQKVEQLIQANIGLAAACALLVLLVSPRFSIMGLLFPALSIGLSVYLLQQIKK